METTPAAEPIATPDKPRLVRYALVQASKQQELVDQVAEYVAKGYVPCGGVSILYETWESNSGANYAQAMFLPKRRLHPLVKFWRGLGKLIAAILEGDDSMPTP